MTDTTSLIVEASDASNVSLIEKLKALRPNADAPELSERAYRQAIDDCIELIMGEPLSHPEGKCNGLSSPASLLTKLQSLKYPNPLSTPQSCVNAAINEAIAVVKQHLAAITNFIEGGASTRKDEGARPCVDYSPTISSEISVVDRLISMADQTDNSQEFNTLYEAAAIIRRTTEPVNEASIKAISFGDGYNKGFEAAMACKPVPVSVEVCARAALEKMFPNQFTKDFPLKTLKTFEAWSVTKAVLDAAGVKYVD